MSGGKRNLTIIANDGICFINHLQMSSNAIIQQFCIEIKPENDVV